jgi:hypothetical protein
MPTFEVQQRFWNEYEQLTHRQQVLFESARQQFIEVLSAWEQDGCRGVPRFPARLGVKPMVNQRNILELAWAPDGRCTWQFGTPQRTGLCHVVWRRIGSHAIYADP